MNIKLDPEKTIYLIDGSSFLYRAYYGTRPLHTLDGKPVHAIYSFCRMIKKLTDKFKPHYLAIVWDMPGKTQRHEIYSEYKATRQAAPSDLFVQKEKIVEFADLVGIQQIGKQGYEADDLLYALAKDLSAQGNSVVLITSDKDMGQVISEQVVLFDPFKELFIDEEKFKELMGFPSAQLPFYYALLGDTSDNIPGVKGVGEKTALDLVQRYKSLQDLYEHLDEVQKPRTKQALAEQKDNAFLSYKLFLLHYTPLEKNKQDFAFDSTRWAAARPLFIELQFSSLLKDLDKGQEVQETSLQDKIEKIKKYNFVTITNAAQLQDLIEKLTGATEIALDTETDGLAALECNLVGISLCVQEGEAFYVPCKHTTHTELTCEQILTAFRPLLQNAQKPKLFHQANFDQLVLYSAGIDVKGTAFDTIIAASLVTKDWQRLGLKYLSAYYLEESMLTFEEVVKNQKLKNFAQVPLDLATLYAANDAHQTLRLTKLFREKMIQEGVNELFDKIEMPLVPILYEMEKRGIYVDKQELQELSVQVDMQLQLIMQEIQTLIGENMNDLNLNSPKQVEELLFYKLLLPPQKKSAKRKGYSTDQEVLSLLSKMHPVPGLILKYRELFKLKSTYIDALPEYILPKTNRIHTTFSQTAAETGRLASFEPNLQNIPLGSADSLAGKIRHAFKASHGYSFISADYSQIELRVLAYLSQDKNLLQAFERKLDIHKETASRLFDVPLQQVTSEQRQIGKRINFSILYGLTPYGLSKDLDISFKDAKHYIEKYFEQYPGVSAWMESVVQSAKDNGYVTTLWGRKRWIPAIYEKNKTLYEEARRIAINTVAQGTAAEIVKQAMIKLHKQFKDEKLDAHILLQIHDELLIEVKDELLQSVQKMVKDTLEQIVHWNVALEVNMRHGKTWLEVSK